MTTLITGGTGFIGSRLALDYADRGEPVRVLAKINNANEQFCHDEVAKAGAEMIIGDMCDPAITANAMEGVKTLYHLAAAQHEANVDDDYFRRNNVGGTKTILDAAVDAKVDRVVHSSTIGVYGQMDQGHVHDQTPLFPDNIYGQTKLEGEHLVRSYQDRLKLTIIRTCETFGPGDFRLLKLFKGIKSKKFFMIGKGENLHHLLYIDDLIDGLKRAATAEEAIGETFVIPGHRPVTTQEMVEGISQALGTSSPKIRVPLPLMMSAAKVCEDICRPMGIQPPLHRRRMNFFVKSFKFSGDNIRQKLAFEAKTDFNEGAKRTAKWYQDAGMI